MAFNSEDAAAQGKTSVCRKLGISDMHQRGTETKPVSSLVKLNYSLHLVNISCNQITTL